MRDLHQPFSDLSDTMNDALDHILLKLRLRKERTRFRNNRAAQAQSKDVEASPSPSDPGSAGFYDRLRKDLEIFYRRREPVLRAWCKEQGIELPTDSFQSQFSCLNHGSEAELFKTHRQRQLFVLLDVGSPKQKGTQTIINSWIDSFTDV